jgi:hypothetical protein
MATSFEPSVSVVEGAKERFQAIGIIAALIVGLSVLFVLVGIPKIWEFIQQSRDPIGGSLAGFVPEVFLVGSFGLGCVGIATGIGLYFHWRWARVSILIFSVLVPYLFIMLLITFLSDPTFFKPAVGLSHVFGAAVFVLAMGIWCLSYFNRKSVKRLF